MSKSKIELAERLAQETPKLKRLKNKRAIADEPSELLVPSETRKGILRYFGSGIWKGGLKRLRRNRV
jgi:hypothetical protein